MRILCFHGFRTSASIMKLQMSHFLREFPEHEFVFLNGLIETNETYPEVEFYFGKQSKYYEWYNDDKTIQKCIEYFRNFDFNYDLYIGFSQGASVCSILINEGLIRDAILIAHGIYIPQDLFRTTQKCRTLHLIGLQDPFREYGENAVKLYREPVLHRFDDNHRIPVDKVTMDVVKKFISQLL